MIQKFLRIREKMQSHLASKRTNKRTGMSGTMPLIRGKKKNIENRVVDPDWILIQRLCGSGSVLGIGNPDPGSGSRGKKVKKFQ
jgi:hypothetical protein